MLLRPRGTGHAGPRRTATRGPAPSWRRGRAGRADRARHPRRIRDRRCPPRHRGGGRAPRVARVSPSAACMRRIRSRRNSTGIRQRERIEEHEPGGHEHSPSSRESMERSRQHDHRRDRDRERDRAEHPPLVGEQERRGDDGRREHDPRDGQRAEEQSRWGAQQHALLVAICDRVRSGERDVVSRHQCGRNDRCHERADRGGARRRAVNRCEHRDDDERRRDDVERRQRPRSRSDDGEQADGPRGPAQRFRDECRRVAPVARRGCERGAGSERQRAPHDPQGPDHHGSRCTGLTQVHSVRIGRAKIASIRHRQHLRGGRFGHASRAFV